ncbi:hypothetical protein [Sphingomonas rubra]|nr:hypothetical protein [Sphingomonas rubra]
MGEKLHWWQTRMFVAAMAFAAAVPLLWPDIPPLVDLPGHMGRYRVQLAIGDNPWLNQWYDFRWSLIGNLGIDLLIIPLAPLVGLEWAVKLIVIAIPVLTVTGLLWIAREVHGRIPATALFALPLAYSYPFQFGFVNFALSLALALNLFAWWLRLARQGRLRFRAIVFVPLSCALWVCHTFGWGVLGVLAFSAEMIRQHDRRKGERADGGGRHWLAAWVRAGLGCLPLALPMILMVAWRSGDHVTGQTADWFNWRAKINWVLMVLRDRWMAWDIAGVTLLFVILLKGVRDDRIEYSRNLGLSALFLAAVYLVLPRIVFGSAYADMRLAPYVLAIALIALRPRRGLSLRGSATMAALGLAFFGARLAGTTASYWLYDRSYDEALTALSVIPERARVVSFVGRRCRDDWAYSRLEHVPALLLERRLAYTNDQWSMPGAQQLTARYRAARGFAHDPSQVVTDRRCRGEWWRPVNMALAQFPRTAFDYVWLIRPPAYDPALTRGLTPIWRRGTSVLFRVDDTPAGRTQPLLNGVSSPR